MHLRVDDRGGAKIMVSPPLIATGDELHDMLERMSQVLDRLPSEMR